jgi:5-methyltetrahydrofolate--homocysteine methyltransferase
MRALLERIHAGEVLVCDGAMGTELIARGLVIGECPEAWCVSHPDAVQAIAAGYCDAGADIVETNSFGGTTIKLGALGLAERADELNSAAAGLAKSAVGDRGYVAGSVGPTGVFVKGEGGKIPAPELYDVFKQQVLALAAGGADAIFIETMWSIQESEQAIRAAKEHTSLPVFCTFTFSPGPKGFRTAVGVSPERAAQAAVKAGADVVGANCGNGVDQMVEIAKQIRAAVPATPVLIQANAGLPTMENGKAVYSESPEFMASRIPDLLAAGVNIVGGCCGTTPAHIRAIAEVVRSKSCAAS